MKNIFIWAWSWSEHKICAYQSTVVYEFFLQNWYNLVNTPNKADLIILNWYPFEEFEEKINLLTINYYLKKYQNTPILLIWSIPWMMSYMSKVPRIQMIWWKELSKFDEKFEHKISINNIEVDNIKFFIPLSIESLNIDKYWYEWRNIESKHNFIDSDYKITVEDIISWDYEIWEIKEYDWEKNNYLEDISWEYPIEICTWCWWYCSYCDIRNVSWFVKSKPIENIINKIKRWLILWYKEFHFIDEDSASYWLDINKDFADLLNEVNKIEWDFKIKIFYFEPWRLEKLFEKIDKTLWKKIIGFWVPLQTTSQRILKLMNRNYNIKKVVKIVGNIKKINPKVTIFTQFIYWFPTETFEEFKDYFNMLRNFDILWFYYYSDRLWTKATNFSSKVDKKELSRRMIFLRKVKEKYLDRIFDKNLSLSIWLKIISARSF